MKYEYKMFNYRDWITDEPAINEASRKGFRIVDVTDSRYHNSLVVFMEREIQESFKSEPI